MWCSVRGFSDMTSVPTLPSEHITVKDVSNEPNAFEI